MQVPKLRAAVARTRCVPVGIAIGLRGAVKAVWQYGIPFKDNHLQQAGFAIAWLANQEPTALILFRLLVDTCHFA